MLMVPCIVRAELRLVIIQNVIRSSREQEEEAREKGRMDVHVLSPHRASACPDAQCAATAQPQLRRHRNALWLCHLQFLWIQDSKTMLASS